MDTKYIGKVKINNLSKDEFLKEVDNLILKKEPSYVVTPYSEFIINAYKDSDFLRVINQATISTPDGFGIVLGLKYLSLKGVYTPMFKSLFSALFNRSFFKGIIKEKLSGADIIYDVSEMASHKKYRIFLLGGFDFGKGNTGELTRVKLEELYPDIEIVGVYSGDSEEKNEESIIKLINSTKPDILFIAYGPVKQEKWINRNLLKLNPMVSFCLGGTFDYVSGEKRRVPKIFRKMGLEGILRPFFSERGSPKLILKRFKRAWGGIIKYIFFLIKLKKESEKK